MKFSDMKLQATNAVRAYFVRNWTREDLMNTGEMTQHAYASLKRLYLWIILALDMGSRRAVRNPLASLLCLYFISPLRVRTRVLLLMIAAFSISDSIGIFTKYFFDIDQELVCRLLAPPTLGIGIIWFGSTFTRERSAIYKGSLFYSSLLFFSTFNANNSEYIDSHTTHRMLKVCIVFALFMGYLWYIAKRYCMMLTLEKLTLSIAHSPSSSIYRVYWSMLQDYAWVHKLNNTDRITELMLIHLEL